MGNAPLFMMTITIGILRDKRMMVPTQVFSCDLGTLANEKLQENYIKMEVNTLVYTTLPTTV